MKLLLCPSLILIIPSPQSDSDVVTLTDENFKKLVLDSEDLWLVEFYAPWCGHCKNLEPHWAKAASELKGKVSIYLKSLSNIYISSIRQNIIGQDTNCSS